MVSGFITEAQAKKGWLTRIVNYVANGHLDIGADNGATNICFVVSLIVFCSLTLGIFLAANVLVQDRETGELLDERMSTMIRIGIRSVYKNKLRKGLDTKMVRAFLLNMTMRQGKKFNDPKSKDSIKRTPPFVLLHFPDDDLNELLLLPNAAFVEFHNLNTSEMLEPLDYFQTFNEFFYRKLKPGARSICSEDPRVAVSPADCRMMAFPNINEATRSEIVIVVQRNKSSLLTSDIRLWIKGKEFSVKNLLQNQEVANYFKDGSLAVFRLAPQDYHRYHAPVDGILGEFVAIPGTYYTVNPMAIREKAKRGLILSGC